MKILITGTDGFVGTELKAYFQEKGYDVFGTVFMRDAEENEVRFDIQHAEEFTKLPQTRYDVVIHTVGVVDQNASGKVMLQVNAEGTKKMLNWAKANSCGHFIHISSISAYGFKANGVNRSEENTKRYDGLISIPYMRSKALAEKYIEQNNIPYTMLRLPTIYGKNDSFFSQTIIPRLKNGKFYFSGNEDKLISTMYIKNLPPIIEKIIKAGPLNDAFNCIDHHIYWSEFVGEFAKLLNVDPGNKKKSVLSILFRLNDKQWGLMICFSYFGSHFPGKKLKQRLDGYPVLYSWQEGVKDAVASYR